ncbi:signal peptidase I [Halopiger djelfimassiliensis]|uniref:signal peptidase I n=1 Tax=Halopiger djelfimassiliensis TaxID=1293047 RepID=UPI00067799E9|nr:signal peptidase I [Halopiger djelfimassiliensis]
MIRRGAGWVLQGLVLVTVLAMVAGQILGQPILLGFVETGSMEPTIETGDGFVAIPSQLTGEPEPGDVVVFEAERIQGGGLTTHRIVEETPQGYVTRGDANPVTDQDGDEPPVTDDRIVAEAWQVNGDVVTVPRFGTAVMTASAGLERVEARLATVTGTRTPFGASGLPFLLLGLSTVLYAVETVRERRSPSLESRFGRDESRLDPRHLSALFALFVVVAAAAAMTVPAGTQSYDVISAEFDSEQPLVIEQGTVEELPFPVSNGGFVPVVSYVEAGGEHATVDAGPTTVGPRDEREVGLTIRAPDERGHYPTTVTERRYLHVLPVSVIDALYGVHPWVPFVAVLSVLGGTTYGLSRLVLGPADPRSRRTSARGRRSTRRRL